MATSISTKALCKCFLHASKYPYSSVNGVFLARKKDYKDLKHIAIVDCIPLFHQSVALAPMLEAALLQVDSYCEANNLLIAGYYHGNEHIKNKEPNSVAIRIADRIQDNFNEALLCVIDNERMSPDCGGDIFTVYKIQDGKWNKSTNTSLIPKEGSFSEACVQFLSLKLQDSLVDFDNHLDDITKDWLNPYLDDELKTFQEERRSH